MFPSVQNYKILKYLLALFSRSILKCSKLQQLFSISNLILWNSREFQREEKICKLSGKLMCNIIVNYLFEKVTTEFANYQLNALVQLRFSSFLW